MTRRQQRMLGVIALVAGAVLATAFTLTAFRKNLMSFYTPSDITAQTPQGAKMRLGGLVETGTLKRLGGLKVEFIVADCTHKVPVRYEGLLPDLFREGQGIVATGELDAERVFVADEVLAKHDENYMPPQVAESLKTPAGHSCLPFKPVGKPVSEAVRS
jgi:cytochrome c-type biogenesis protein CcmE